MFWANQKKYIVKEELSEAYHPVAFSVSDGETVYDLVYNTEDQGFLLNEIEVIFANIDY